MTKKVRKTTLFQRLRVKATCDWIIVQQHLPLICMVQAAFTARIVTCLTNCFFLKEKMRF